MQIEDDRFKPNHINNYTIFNVLNPPIMKDFLIMLRKQYLTIFCLQTSTWYIVKNKKRIKNYIMQTLAIKAGVTILLSSKSASKIRKITKNRGISN